MSAAHPTRGALVPESSTTRFQEMYDRGLVAEEPQAAAPYAGPPGYPPLCAHGMNSLTDRRYDLALARMRRV